MIFNMSHTAPPLGSHALQCLVTSPLLPNLTQFNAAPESRTQERVTLDQFCLLGRGWRKDSDHQPSISQLKKLFPKHLTVASFSQVPATRHEGSDQRMLVSIQLQTQRKAFLLDKSQAGPVYFLVTDFQKRSRIYCSAIYLLERLLKA